MIEYAGQEWERAGRTLESARVLLESDPDSAASRAYYAAFHAVTALFALRGESFTRHTALRAAVHRELVKSAEWPVSLGKDFDYLMAMREVGDYGGPVRVDLEDAQAAVACTTRILAAVQAACPELK